MKSHIHSLNLLLEVVRILSAIKSSSLVMACWTVRERNTDYGPTDMESVALDPIYRVHKLYHILIVLKSLEMKITSTQSSKEFERLGTTHILVIQDEDNMEDSVNLIVSTVPLAEQMRPVDLTCFVGQNHVLGQDKVLRTLLQKQDIPSMILWGPPGCGKTTLAHIIAKQCRGGAGRVRFVKLSATMSGVNEIKEAVKVAKNELGFKRRTILFMDEIHRFNKLQQDIFLPHIESGTITLIGATTENPSFSLNSALLSRCRVIVLEKLDTESLVTILTRAVRGVGGRVVHQGLTSSEQDTPRGVLGPLQYRMLHRFLMDSETVLWLAEMCDGDARIALNSLQLALQSQDSIPGRILMISLDDIKDGVKRSHLLYDKKGEEHYNIISAMHKSIRASDDNAALYWLTRMLQGGEDPVFIARRLVRAASEDIGTVRLSRLMLRAYLWFVSTALKFIDKIDISR
uniref:AAA+ ATPase domain-containing protein n=1 Tax=Timema genevievae TaxID=629358 RepID=A0A7R9PL90_TIMGE|nr:unnamed protein product [Timema genevievae]